MCDVSVPRDECARGVCNPSRLFPILGCHCEINFLNCLKVRPSKLNDSLCFMYKV